MERAGLPTADSRQLPLFTRANPKATRLFPCPLEQVTLHGPSTLAMCSCCSGLPVHKASELRSLPLLARAEEKNSPYCPAACEKEEQNFHGEAVAPVRSGNYHLSCSRLARPLL